MRKYLIGFIVVLLLALVYFYRQAQSHEANYQRVTSNIEALQDSVQRYRTRSGQLGAEKRSLQATKEDLQKLNDSLAQELEEEPGDVQTITKIRTEVRTDTVRVPTIIDTVSGRKPRYTWSFYQRYDSDNYTRLEGYTTEDSTTITNQSIGLSLVTGIKEKDSQPYIFVRSGHPNLTINDIDGAIVEEDWFSESRKNFIVGPFIGGGWGRGGFSPIIGIGVTYRLWSF